MRLGLTARTLFASAVLAAVLGVAFSGLVLAIGGLRDSAEESRRVQLVLARASQYQQLVIDLQSGTRGYVITGNAAFLEPSNEARRRIPSIQAELAELVREPGQRGRLATIEAAVESYLEDYADPLVEQAREDRAAARRTVSGGEGKRRVDEIRRQFAAFEVQSEALTEQRARRVDRSADRAVLVAAGGLAASLGLVLLFALYMSRAVAGPVRRLAGAAGRLSAGDLGARVAPHGRNEVGELGRAFNTMAASLEQSRDELEAQNNELEAQQVELEAQQVELETQQGELEVTLDELADEKERVQTLYEFGEALSAETRVEALSETLLLRLCDVAGAELGALYVMDDNGGAYRLAASRGLEAVRLSAEILPGDGLPGRALAERRPVRASHGESGLRVPAFGEVVAVRHELHLPLVQGGRTLGVLTLARVGEREFAAADLGLVEPLADQAAVALSNVLAFRRAEGLAQLNRVVLDATVDGIFMLDLEGNFVVHNAAIAAIADERGTVAEGNIYDRLEAVAETTADPDRYREWWRAIAADPELEATDEFTHTDLGRTLFVHTAPVRGDDGEVLGRIFTIHDVTKEREADRMKSELVATVSHELRTPLASILGFTELMTTRKMDEEERERYLRTIHGEARRLTDLVNDFLDLERIEEGRLTLDLAPFELGELIRQQSDLFAGQSEAHTISLALPDDPIEVVGERDRIAQVVGNLISNAIKYSPVGGPVDVTAERRNGRVRVSIGDRGLGIPGDQQARIFTKFFRVDTSDTRRLGGTGLGLALSREIVEAHGGHMGFESAEGRGSTFWFELPGQRAGDVAVQLRVLVIEDDAEAAALLREWLEADGYAVEIVVTGEEGLAQAADRAPDVVCLDIRLAGEIDGWEVLARLKAAPGTASVPVVVCTGGNGRDQAAALGAADFLSKPISPEALRQAVARLVQGDGRVLIVDDDPGVRRLVVESLRSPSLEVEEAADGEEALAAVAARLPDVVVLDLVMPGTDGFEVLERLQADPSTRTIPVIVLTAKRLSGQERERLRKRAVSVLEKSTYSATELRRLVDLALGR